MKNKTLLTLFIISIIISMIYVSFIVIIDLNLLNNNLILFIFGTVLFISNFIIMAASYLFIKTKKEKINKSFNFYIENLVSNVGVGLISFNKDGEIIWVSDFLTKRFKKNIVGKKLISISPTFKTKYLKGEQVFRFDIDNIVYEANVNYENKAIILKDVTSESIISKQYFSEKVVLGELEVDNFQHYQIILPQEELFRVQSEVTNMLEDLSDKYNLIYRQYVNGKFIIITDQDTVEKFIKSRFNFLDQIRKINVIDGIQLTASIGFGHGTTNQQELIKLAKEGLLQAQSRGGDQVGLLRSGSKPKFFGSKTEIAKTFSKVKVKQVSKLLEKKMADPKIKTVIIYGHNYADLDAIGAALGIYSIAKTYKKNVYIQNVNYDKTTSNALNKLFKKEEMSSIFIKPSKANRLTNSTSTLVVIVDIAEPTRTENPDAFKKLNKNNLFVFDHHRIGELDKKILSTNIYSDTTASSTSEIITEVIQFMDKKVKLSKRTAQMMLNGIYLDTMQFQKSTSSRTFQASAFLEKNGASAASSVEVLKMSNEDEKIIRNILAKLKEVKEGYYLASYPGEAPSDIISKAADEILRTSGRKGAFVIAKLPGSRKNIFKLSARGIDTNVQIIAEEVGGGGHFSAAAATSEEPLTIFTDNVIQAIISKGD